MSGDRKDKRVRGVTFFTPTVQMVPSVTGPWVHLTDFEAVFVRYLQFERLCQAALDADGISAPFRQRLIDLIDADLEDVPGALPRPGEPMG